MVEQLEKRYGFLETPRSLSQFNTAKGVTFAHGKFQDTVIDKFQIYENGLVAEANTESRITDAFLEEIVNFLTKDCGFQINDLQKPTYAYVSQVEVQFEVDISLDSLNKIGAFVSGLLNSYGVSLPDYRASGFLVHCDTPRDAPRPHKFRVERREGYPCELNVYFCSAPLRTPDHIKALRFLESVFRG